jgi:hypothetical protein
MLATEPTPSRSPIAFNSFSLVWEKKIKKISRAFHQTLWCKFAIKNQNEERNSSSIYRTSQSAIIQ